MSNLMNRIRHALGKQHSSAAALTPAAERLEMLGRLASQRIRLARLDAGIDAKRPTIGPKPRRRVSDH